MTAEAIIKVRFLTSEEGGRQKSISGEKYGCPIIVDGSGFDCRFVFNQKINLNLGEVYEIPVKFLNPEKALSHLNEGVKISLWEGKTIGTGTVLKLII